MKGECGWPKASAHMSSQGFLVWLLREKSSSLASLLLSSKVIRLLRVFLLSRSDVTLYTATKWHMSHSFRMLTPLWKNQSKRRHLFQGIHLKHTEAIRPATETLPGWSLGSPLPQHKHSSGAGSKPDDPGKENQAQRWGVTAPRYTGIRGKHRN